MGVANKTLPCGTPVRVCMTPRGPCANVTVIDRGPYVEGREYDLTEATARQIGFLAEGVGPVWVGVGLAPRPLSGAPYRLPAAGEGPWPLARFHFSPPTGFRLLWRGLASLRGSGAVVA